MPSYFDPADLQTFRSLSPEAADPSYVLLSEADADTIEPTPYIYRKRVGDVLVPMDAGEMATADAAILAALQVQNRADTVGELGEVSQIGVRVRALIELLNKRDNYLVNRLNEITAALSTMKAAGGNANAKIDTLPDTWLATSTRTKADAITDYTNDINAGNQDS